MVHSKIERENYITVQGFMVSELGLKGNELLIYALIYGFSQAENQAFTGSLQYLANWTNSTKQSVIQNLKSLVEKGYIIKKDNFNNGVKNVEYYATKFNGVLKKVERGIKESLTPPIKKSLPNNIDIDNIEDNINNKKKNIKKKNESMSVLFIPPNVEEVKKYCVERENNVDAEKFVDYYTSNGWMVGKNKMKDWKAAVRTWEKSKFQQNVKTEQEIVRWGGTYL